jgi:hypothetical protein
LIFTDQSLKHHSVNFSISIEWSDRKQYVSAAIAVILENVGTMLFLGKILEERLLYSEILQQQSFHERGRQMAKMIE